MNAARKQIKLNTLHSVRKCAYNSPFVENSSFAARYSRFSQNKDL